MIPDNIQANIMKYLNNGVSGSSQEQKPVVSPNYYQIPDRIFNVAKSYYVTEDNQYIICNMREYATAKYCLKVISVNDTLNEQFAETFYVPDYNGYTFYQVANLNRLEDGRFYGVFEFTLPNEQPKDYLMILNDFITDGILVINKAYDLANFTFTYNNYQFTYKIFNSAINVNNSGEYIFYSEDMGPVQIDNTATKWKYFIGKLTINVDGGIEQKEWYFNLKNETDDNGTQIRNISINTTNETPYMLAGYYDERIRVEDGGGAFHYDPTNYKVGKVYLTNSNDELTSTNMQVLYSVSDYIASADFQGRYYRRNGTYIDNVIENKNGDIVTLKYTFVRADGTTKVIDFPSTFNIPDYLYSNISIVDDLLFVGLLRENNNTIRQLYKIDIINNTIELVQDIEIPTAEIVIIKQFNIYFVFSLLIYVRMYTIRDVPTYGRDCLLKQKFLNSKLFRAIKFKRNRRTNIQ